MSRLKIFFLCLTALVLLFAAVFTYYLYRPQRLPAPVTDGAGYELYANLAGRYAIQVPAGWGILDEGNTSVLMFPDSKGVLTLESVDDIKLKRDLGISVNTLTPEPGADLPAAYERLASDAKKVDGTFSPIVAQVRADISTGKNEDGFSGTTYWVLTGKRVYVVETAYRTPDADKEARRHVGQILYGLREE